MNIRQCKRCKKIFNYSGNIICPDCIRALDQKFIEVRDYIYDNPDALIETVCEETGAETADIHRWLREGRLMLTNNSIPLLNCKSCGAPIFTGQMCDKCMMDVKTKFQKTAASLKPAETLKSVQDGKMHIDRKK